MNQGDAEMVRHHCFARHKGTGMLAAIVASKPGRGLSLRGVEPLSGSNLCGAGSRSLAIASAGG